MTSCRRIYVECTRTFFAGGNNGIRRVVRNIANYSEAVSDDKVQVIPVVWGGIGFFKPGKRLSEAPHILQRIKNGLDYYVYLVGEACQRMPPMLRRPFKWMKGLLSRRFKGRLNSNLAFLLLGITSFPLKFMLGKRVVLRGEDVVVLVDSTWNSDGMLEYLFRIRLDLGVRLGVMIHDLFPLILPDTCLQETIEGFSRWFEKVAPAVDFFVTNSEATRISLEDYLKKNRSIRPYAYRAGSFPLGAELDLYGSEKKPSKNVSTIWSMPGATILAVGTIEPRKNYPLLLNAFDILYKRNLPVSLIIIGRPGWKSDDVMKRIENHPALGKRLIHLNDASDFDLAQAYERANCMVFGSLGEGFGLPLVEGLMHGLTVFASDIPPFRDIGGQACRYFPADSPRALASLIEDWLIGYQQGAAKPTEFIWPGWEESTRLFTRLALELANPR